MPKKSPNITGQWYLAVTALNTTIAIAICLMNIPLSAFTSSLTGALFLSSALIGHFYVLFLLAGLPGYLVSRIKGAGNNAGMFLIFLSNLLLIILIYLDTRIFELYRFHINGMIFELITGGALQDNLSFDILVWALFLAIGLGFVGVEFFAARFIYKRLLHRPPSRTFIFPFVLTFVLAFSTSQGIHIFANASGNKGVMSLQRYIPWAQPITARRYLRKMGVDVKASSDEDLNVTSDFLAYPKQALSCQANEKPNVLMIVVDSLRADTLSADVMPNMWNMAQQGHHFTEHFSAGNSTRFGIFGLMYGLSANYWHTMLQNKKGSEFIKQFSDHDYQFFIHAAAPLYSPEFDRTVFVDIADKITPSLKNAPAYEKDLHINNNIISNINKHDADQAFFGFLFYDSPHSFSYPDDFEEKFKPSWEKINYLELDNDFDATPFLNRYKNSARYTDMLIGKVISSLKEKKMLDNTIVIFTSDHGQEFNENKNNFWGHNGNFSKYQTQVPLFIYWPKSHPKSQYQLYDNRTASIDIAPTILKNVLNCQNPSEDFSVGHDLYSNYPLEKPILIESWSKRAILGKKSITVFYNTGGSDIFDLNYQPYSKQENSPKDFQTIFKQMSSFYTQ